MSKRDGPTTANNFVRSVRTTRRVRRATSLAILGAGLMTLISALTPSFANRLHYLDQVMPVVVHQAAFAVTVVIGVALIQLAGGVRRGQRRSWLLSVLMLIVAAVLHLVKGLDAEEATVSAVLATVLVTMRHHFRAPSDPAANLWRGRLRIVGSVAVALVAASLSIAGVRRHSLGVGGSFRAVLERVVGNRSVVIGGRLDRFISPALGALGLTLVAFALWALLRPSRTGGPVSADAATARRIIAEHGDDTLAYFALRSDKQRWVFGETLIAYAVINNTCLVSPDPIGP
ncbi:MAG: hypothetical protein ABIQ39_17340, partial [Ilumatobacteraceae bacterium]